jgi:hypothetical protein
MLPTNFCPNHCQCSMNNALTPTNGPKAPSIATQDPDQAPYPVESRGFTGDPKHDPNVGYFSWIPTQGQLVEVSTYTQVFSLIGTNYRGNGRTDFGLPDITDDGNTKYYICMDGEVPGFVGP